ncbi:hypothetical protein [Agromyces sp. SYSU T00194]|uniref:hypothetical protein n=1 Tax=Agromyces chitinivorans TaxID=3158560 RepID=UPI003396AB40
MTEERASWDASDHPLSPGTTRRAALRGAAWTVPVIALAAVAPQAAASVTCQLDVHFLRACIDGEDDAATISLIVRVSNPCPEAAGFSFQLDDQEGIAFASAPWPQMLATGEHADIQVTIPRSFDPDLTEVTATVWPSWGGSIVESVLLGICT